MRRKLIALLAVVGLVVAGIVVVAPKATTTTYDASGIDIPGLTNRAKDLPEQHFVAH